MYNPLINRTAIEEMAPSRPQRPDKRQSNNGTAPHTNGVIHGQPIMSSVGVGQTTVPVNSLPSVKPDGVPRDPRYRVAKARWRVRDLEEGVSSFELRNCV